jgi:hypothetical protein
MPTEVRRVSERSDSMSERMRAKGKESLRDMLPLIETYLNNPTKYCYERIVQFYMYAGEGINYIDLGQTTERSCDMSWTQLLSQTTVPRYEEYQGIILLKMTILKELILDVLYPERHRS